MKCFEFNKVFSVAKDDKLSQSWGCKVDYKLSGNASDC